MVRPSRFTRRITEAHECEWKDAAVLLKAQAVKAAAQLLEASAWIAAHEKRLALLERMFARKSEKFRKMPPVHKPALTQEEIRAKRNRLPAEREAAMDVVTQILHVKPEDKPCTSCHDETFRAADTSKTSVTIHYVQAHLRKHVTKLETVVCAFGKSVISAEPPQQWSEKTQYASSFVAHLITQKCLASMPIYRQETMFAQMGMPIARSTMNDLFYRAAAKLRRPCPGPHEGHSSRLRRAHG